jgi:ABC-type dipeptide/oligopeptide/nickel transport system ATPase subunit
MGFRKTVENFKAGKATTVQGNEARFWVVVFQDYEVRLQTRDQIMEVVTEGHRHREDEDNAKFERSKNGTNEERFTLD